eukprot:763198-Hanusia_phi.AAC.2
MDDFGVPFGYMNLIVVKRSLLREEEGKTMISKFLKASAEAACWIDENVQEVREVSGRSGGTMLRMRLDCLNKIFSGLHLKLILLGFQAAKSLCEGNFHEDLSDVDFNLERSPWSSPLLFPLLSSSLPSLDLSTLSLLTYLVRSPLSDRPSLPDRFPSACCPCSHSPKKLGARNQSEEGGSEFGGTWTTSDGIDS